MNWKIKLMVMESVLMKKIVMILFLSIIIALPITTTPVYAANSTQLLKFQAVLGSAFLSDVTIDINGDGIPDGWLGIDSYHYYEPIEFNLVGYYCANFSWVELPEDQAYIPILVLVDNRYARDLLIAAGYPSRMVRLSGVKVFNLDGKIVARVPSVNPSLPSGVFIYEKDIDELVSDEYSIETPTHYVFTYSYTYRNATLSTLSPGKGHGSFKWGIQPISTERCYISPELTLKIQPPLE